MELPSPNKGKKPTAVVDGKLLYFDNQREETIMAVEPVDPNNPSKGVRQFPQTVIVPENPEIIDENGVSNSRYWKPEVVFNPQDCPHKYKADYPKRIAVCEICSHEVQFHINDVQEVLGKLRIKVNKIFYPLF